MPGRASAGVRAGASRGRDNPRVAARTPSARVRHPLVSLQQSAGNAAVQRLLRSGQIQAKLAINPPGDRFEREADHVSETVARSAGPADVLETTPPAQSISRLPASGLQRVEDQGDEPVAATLQREAAGDEEVQRSVAIQRRNEPVKGDEKGPLQRQEDASPGEEETVARQEDDEPVARQAAADAEQPESAVQRAADGGMTEEATPEEDGDRVAVQTRRASVSGSSAPSVPAGFGSELRAAGGEGMALPADTRSFFESHIGADFGRVRVHTGSRAAALSHSINARAFTRGPDIFFAPGTLDTSSTSGKALLAHELTHVVQQGHAPVLPAAQMKSAPASAAAPARTIQRREEPDEGDDDDRPTEEERAAALAAAARAKKVVTQTVATGKKEVTKSKEEQAKENQQKDASGKKARVASGGAEEARKSAKRKKKKRVAGAQARGPEAGGADQAAGPGGPPKAPASPEEDPGFQAVVKKVGVVSTKQRGHAPAGTKAEEAQAAAEAPKEEVTGRAQETKAGEMETAPAPAFDAAGFKARLFKRIAELAPKTMEEADEFKDNNRLGGVKQDVQGEVAASEAATKGPLEKTAQEAPNTDAVEPKAVTPIPEAAPGAAPGRVGAAAAAPKEKTAHEIEAPIQENTARIGNELATENITEAQLARSNEPQFHEALAAKQEADTQAAQGPQAYRQFEGGKLSKAEALAAGTAAARTQSMHAGRTDIFGQVHTMQGQTKSKDELARLKVGQDIDKIYQDTKTTVETILDELDGTVEKTFDEGATAARQIFEEYVDAQMEAYKEERYGGWFGWARWAKDKIAGMRDEVNVFYARGRDLYLDKMGAVIDNVVAIIGAELTRAKAEVASGRKKIAEYIAALPDSLKTVGTEAAENALSMFESLEGQITDKEDALIDTLANKYNENLKALDARIEELKEANKGLVAKAIDAVKAVVNAIIEIKNFLKRILAKIAGIISLILDDPIGFLGNLVAGLRQGFGNFVDNIWEHLKAGFIGWLTGALGSTRIQMPEEIFSVQGMFSILTQVLGLSREFAYKRAVKLLGEPAVKVIAATFTPLQILLKDGPGALWEYAKEQFTDLKNMLVDQIKDMIVTQVVQAGIKWIVGLLNPVGAFIKAAMAIYEIVKFLVQKAKQIGEFIESVIDAVAEIAKGNIAGAAKMVEGALARALPLIIGLLASILGLGGLAQKVQKLFASLRKRVEKFVDSLILKAKKLLRGKPAKAGTQPGAPSGKPAGKPVPIVAFPDEKFEAGGEKHRLWVRRDSGRAVLVISSTTQVLGDFLKAVSQNPEIPAKKKESISRGAMINTKLGIMIADAESGRYSGGALEALFRSIARHEEILADLIRLILLDLPITAFDERYRLEGMVATYDAMPEQTRDLLTPDHQPQAALLDRVAALPAFRDRVIQDVVRGGNKQAPGGMTINVHYNRHRQGRTFAGRSKSTLSAASSRIAAGIGAAGADEERQREAVIAVLRDELNADVSAMRGVAARADTDPVWADIARLSLSPPDKARLIVRIRGQIESGENRIQNQRLERLGHHR